MKIWLVRHGLTALGEEKRYQGVLDTSLSEKGQASLRPADFVPEHVYVSPAKRARETAKLLFPASRQIPVPEIIKLPSSSPANAAWSLKRLVRAWQEALL